MKGSLLFSIRSEKVSEIYRPHVEKLAALFVPQDFNESINTRVERVLGNKSQVPLVRV